jgi:hypothetical protein
MEKRYLYSRLLARKLPSRDSGIFDLGDRLELTHIKTEKTGDHEVGLTVEADPLVALFGGEPDAGQESLLTLSELIQAFNEKFGLNLTEADRLHLEGIAREMIADQTVQRQAAANTKENFAHEFDERFIKAIADRYDQAQELTQMLLDQLEARQAAAERLMPQVYEESRVRHQRDCPIGELLERDEDRYLEYKSTLTWDLKEEKRSKVIESAVLKTIAGFLNSSHGGTLVIGVADDREVLGLKPDYETLRKEGRSDADRFIQHLTQAVLNSVGEAAATYVTAQIHTIDGEDACRVHVEPSGHPVDATVHVQSGAQVDKRTAFYVRINNGTRAINDDIQREKDMASRWTAEALR